MPIRQTIFKQHRRYNKWVANETMEDFALRYTARRARKWSAARVTNTALGIVSFLALEAIGGAITLSYGFHNAFWAIACVSFIIFVSGIPICYFAAKTGVDIDLLTRGAGFGYIGSTVSSLIYASFTFIFFALEAAIMSMAITLLTGVPLHWAYVISALVIIPLVTHGIARISVFQLWTQPIWIVLQVVPLVFILLHSETDLNQWLHYPGLDNSGDSFNYLLFGAAAAVIFPLMAQNGEQVDYLRFLPEHSQNTPRWWAALILGGPGWVLVGFVKLLIGSFLAVLAIQHGIAPEFAHDPTHMYMVAFGYLTDNAAVIVLAACLFVILSQIKINVTNAYAGSIAWSNFFSRVTHNHPGRIVWMVFNVLIALLLMELGLYQTFESILITFSALVLSWMGTLVADLTINRPLGLRPKDIHFKRSHLYDINPVGVVSMLLASVIGIAAQLGAFTPEIKASAPFIAFFLPFFTAPLIALMTRGRYYHMERPPEETRVLHDRTRMDGLVACGVCENAFDHEDMSFCPFYAQPICSLCCALDARCHDLCRTEGSLNNQTYAFFSAWLPTVVLSRISKKVAQFLLIYSLSIGLSLIIFSIVYFSANYADPLVSTLIYNALWQAFFLLMIINGVLIWLYVLAEDSKQKAHKESDMQLLLLEDEIVAHQQTEIELHRAKEQAIGANQAKTRYLSGVSHELRTPLNTVYGYAQLIGRDPNLPEKTRHAATMIAKSGEHITDIIEGLLEITKIEAKRVDFLHKEPVDIEALLTTMVDSFSIQARNKGIDLFFECERRLPRQVATDAKRIRQILMNLLSNAIKFTPSGSVTLTVSYRNDVARFSIKDTGLGIPTDQLRTIFDPFERVRSQATQNIPGTGLGLSISRLLVELLGGDISVESTLGNGSTFVFSVLLPAVHTRVATHPPLRQRTHYHGPRRTVLIVDDDPDHRRLLQDLLNPMGFTVFEAAHAQQALAKCQELLVDVLILDVCMPGMDGWQLLQALRQQGVTAPVIMLSGNAVESEQEQMQQASYDAYIIKPVVFDVLLDRIGECLQLSWIYDDESTVVAPSTQKTEAMTWPDSAVIQRLLSAATIGHAQGIQYTLQELKQMDDRYDAFNRAIEAYLVTFDFSGITTWLEGKS